MSKLRPLVTCSGHRAAWAAALLAVAAWAAARGPGRSLPAGPAAHAQDRPPARLDPAAWGDDHVGKRLPEFVSGEECLFCHRMDVGPSWSENRHFQALRPVDRQSPAYRALAAHPAGGELAEQVQYVLGGRRQLAFLRRTKRYGQLALLSAVWRPSPDGGVLAKTDNLRFDEQVFGKSCAGCHASGVDARTHAFVTHSLDCFTCHGDVRLEHSKRPQLALFSKRRKTDPRVVVSACGQCHLRVGKSRSSGLPCPNQFVAGDNLFRDFQVDWSDEQLERLNPADRHVLQNVRDVALRGRGEVTCLSCHSVHGQSTERHQRLKDQAICLNCHRAEGPKSALKPYEVHSQRCGY